MREQDRVYRPIELQMRAERKAERSLQRQYEIEKARYAAADIGWRREREKTRWPRWMKEEWEKL